MMAGFATSKSKEKVAYEHFVHSTLQHVVAGLKIDHTEKKRRIDGVLTKNVLSNDAVSALSPAERVLNGRFALGGDDATYLQTGLSTLWTTAAEDGCATTTSTSVSNGGTGGSGGSGGANPLELAPAGLYAPDAVEGIRNGLMRAMKRRSDELEQIGPLQLKQNVYVLKMFLNDNTIRQCFTSDEITHIENALNFDWCEKTNELRRALEPPNDPKNASALLKDIRTHRDVLIKFLAELRAVLFSANKNEEEAIKNEAIAEEKNKGNHFVEPGPDFEQGLVQRLLKEVQKQASDAQESANNAKIVQGVHLPSHGGRMHARIPTPTRCCW